MSAAVAPIGVGNRIVNMSVNDRRVLARMMVDGAVHRHQMVDDGLTQSRLMLRVTACVQVADRVHRVAQRLQCSSCTGVPRTVSCGW